MAETVRSAKAFRCGDFDRVNAMYAGRRNAFIEFDQDDLKRGVPQHRRSNSKNRGGRQLLGDCRIGTLLRCGAIVGMIAIEPCAAGFVEHFRQLIEFFAATERSGQSSTKRTA